MRDVGSSPFTPGYGALPLVWAGRESEFADYRRAVGRVRRGVYEQARLLTGDRGLGKTALLRELRLEAQAEGDWAVYVSATRGDTALLDLVREVAEEIARRDLAFRVTSSVLGALRRVAGVSFASGAVEFAPVDSNPDSRARDLRLLLLEAALLARERGQALVLLIDEAQNLDSRAIGDLFHALQEVQNHTLLTDHPTGAQIRSVPPVLVYVAGLPGLVGHLKNSGSTFGERSKLLDLELLSKAEIREALTGLAAGEEVVLDAPALDLLVERIGGYPYFLHLLGDHVWLAGTGVVVTLEEVRQGLRHAAPHVRNFYEERLRELSERQRDYLSALAALPVEGRTSATVAAALGGRSSAWGSTQQQLIDVHGLLRRARGRGNLAFTIPGLDAHLRDEGDLTGRRG